MIDSLMKCFNTPDFISFVITIVLFALFYLAFIGMLLFFRKVLSKQSFTRRLVEELRWPLFFILLEIALVFFMNIFVHEERFKNPIQHMLVIFIIGTIGWGIARIVKTFFTYIMMKLEKDSTTDLHARSSFTQILFLYHIVMFVIVVVTLAIILVTFPYVKTVGIGLLSSAGIIGIALGIAARPIFLNIMAGFQIAMTKTIKIGDAVFIEGDFCRIESMHLTHVVARTWDLRRIIFPISYFIDKTFQNWDIENQELLGSVFIYCDYRMPVDAIRKKTDELLKETPFWNGKTVKVEVHDTNEQAMTVRILASANDASACNDLKAFLREKLLDFLQKEYPDMLPCQRNRAYPEKTDLK